MTRERRFAGLRHVLRLPSTARSVDREVDEEIRFHIESRIADLVARGMSPAHAREEAMRHYGDVSESRRELARVDRTRLSRQRWRDWFDGMRQDAAFALRVFKTQPGFALGSVFVLALGIGANATMFAVIDRLLLRPPAQIADPSRVMLVRLERSFRGEINSQDALSYPIYLDLTQTSRVFQDVAVYSEVTLAVGRGADARSVSAVKASASYFRTLGVRPRMGRFFDSDADDSPAPNVAVVSYTYWQRDLSGDPQVIGRPFSVGDLRFTIIGVAPAGFTGITPTPVDMWVPLTIGVSAQERQAWTQSRNGYWLLGVTRLAPTTTRAAAAAEATRALRAGARRDGESDERLAEQRPSIAFLSVLPSERRAGDVGARVAKLLGAVSVVVLLIACANVANLQLARGLARRREIAIRLALGVSRMRLLSQLLVESLVLSVAGGIGALVVIYWGSGFVRRILTGSSELGGAAVIDARVLMYTAGASIVVGVLSGLLPALQAGRASVVGELKEGARQSGGQRTRARGALLLAQTLLSVVLLTGTGLFVRSLARIDALPLGLEPSRVLVGTIQTSGLNYSNSEISALYGRLMESAAGSPDVASAAIASTLPFYTSWAVRVRVPGRDSLPRVKDGGPYINEITPRYFETVGTRMLQGRSFTSADAATAPRVVIVNENLAKLWWPGTSAIGKCMKIGGDTMPCSEIVGISENSRRQGLIEDPSVQYFIPMAQSIRTQNVSPILFVRPRGDASASLAPLRRRLQGAAPNLPYVSLRSLEDLVSPQKRSWRLGATMFALFGGLALLLAAVGLYSVLAYDVAQRTREFGVRVAMGARGSDVMQLVLASGLRTAIVGCVAGLIVALLAGRFVAPLLFQTSPRDPIVLVTVSVVVTAVAMLAAFLPARRAVRVDPIVALRAE